MTRLQGSLLGAVSALVLIGVAYVMVQRRPSVAELAEQAARDRQVHRFEPEDLKKVRVETATESFSFEKDSMYGWRLTEPVDWPADLEATQGLVQRLAWLESDRVVYEQPTKAELRASGLEPPRVRVFMTVEGPEGTAIQTLRVGAENPLTERVYVQTDDEQVRGVPKPYIVPLLRSPRYFRETRLFPVAQERIRRLEFHREDLNWFLERRRRGFAVRADAAEPWRPADPGRMGVLLALVSLRLEAETFLADDLPSWKDIPEAEGAISKLVRDPVRLSVELEDGRTRSATIALARRSFAREEAPVAWVEGTAMELYPPPVKELLEVNAHQLRDRTLLNLVPTRIARIELRYRGQEPLDLIREQDEWVVEAGREPVVQWMVKNLLVRAMSLRGEDTVTLDPTTEELKRFGLRPPLRQLRFLDEEGQELALLRLGGSAGGGYTYAQSDPSRRVELVPDPELVKVPLDLSRFRARP